MSSLPIKFVGRMRRLQLDKDGRREWLDKDPLRNPLQFSSCHWGQLKLLYGEIEFLTMAAQAHDLSTCTVVYAGAAPGHSIGLLRRMFPTLHFILVDPASFVAKADSHVSILNTLFTDQTVLSIVADQTTKGMTILFMSDIRLTVDDADGFEDAVFADMLSQQKWCIDLNCAMAMLKFRLPFANVSTGPRDMRYDYKSVLRKDRVSLRKTVPRNSTMVPPGSMVYLDGEIRLQLYPPSDSAETRLIVTRPKTGKFMLRSYDYLAYEQTMVHFNIVVRRAMYTFPNSAMLGANVAGFDTGSYECASEAWIISEYVRVLLPSTTAPEASRAVVRVVYTIHRDLWDLLKKSVVTCKFGTPNAASVVARHNGLERSISRVISQGIETLQGIRKTIDEVAKVCKDRATAQITSFTAMASQLQSSTLVLRRTDYLAQVTWLRSEISEVQRLHTLYSDIVTRLESGRRVRRR